MEMGEKILSGVRRRDAGLSGGAHGENYIRRMFACR
jgi:hypothetical protein